MGGGTLAYALRDCGARILLIERGDFLPQEPQNWQVNAVFDEAATNRRKTGLTHPANKLSSRVFTTT